MTDYERDILVSGFVVGFMFIWGGMLDYTLKTNNYQTALKLVTECRVQTKLNPDEICGKIPTWEQYK
jgi:hypothetical protein